MRTLATTSMSTRTAWTTLLFVTACYGGGEPAGPLLTGTDSIQQGDRDRDDSDDDREEDEDNDEGAGDESTGDRGTSGGDSKNPLSPADVEVTACLKAEVAALRTKLSMCRTCHVPKGLARDSHFVLSKDASEDAANLLLAFEELGQDLLLMPAQENGKKHPGGRRLTKGTADYDAWLELMDVLADPESCADE